MSFKVNKDRVRMFHLNSGYVVMAELDNTSATEFGLFNILQMIPEGNGMSFAPFAFTDYPSDTMFKLQKSAISVGPYVPVSSLVSGYCSALGDDTPDIFVPENKIII